MTAEVEAFGALTTAGLVASTLDRPAAPAHGHHPETCANCATALTGDFCHACGQAGHLHRSIGHVFEEFLHGVWHFDSKAWRTLPLLAFRPGRLTRDYVRGRRVRYIAPLALFLLSIFLMFFVFGFIGMPDLGESTVSAGTGEVEAAVADARAEQAAAAIALATARRENAPAAKLGELRNDLATAELASRLVEQQFGAAERTVAIPAAAGDKRWFDYVAERARAGKYTVDTGSPKADANIAKALKDPEFALYKVQQKAYKLSFLLVPLSVPILWLMFFWKRDVRVYDHVIFLLYSLAFMSLLVIVMALLAIAGGLWGTLAGWLMLVPPVHMYAQLKGAYALSTWSALWRTVVLSVAAIAVLSIFAGLIVTLGLAD